MIRCLAFAFTAIFKSRARLVAESLCLRQQLIGFEVCARTVARYMQRGTDKLVLAPSRSPNEMLPTAQLHNSKTQKRTA